MRSHARDQSKRAWRKERATAECERQIRRYGYECGEVVTYKLSPEQMKQVLTGRKTVDDFIKEGK